MVLVPPTNLSWTWIRLIKTCFFIITNSFKIYLRPCTLKKKISLNFLVLNLITRLTKIFNESFDGRITSKTVLAIVQILSEIQLYQSRKMIEKVRTKRKSKGKVLLLLFRCIAGDNSLFPSSTFFVASTTQRKVWEWIANQRAKKKKKNT